MSSDSPSASILETFQKTTETVAEFIRWLAELIQRRNWFMLLVLAGVGLAFIGQFFKDWINQQFEKFPWGLFWLIVGGIFVTALAVAVVTMPRATDAEPVDLTERKAIKGLRPFRREDAEIFSRLQRNRILRDCLEAILSPTFRIGVLMGDSGCGKTSFMQAGMWPTLSQSDTSHSGVYVRFSDQEPTETVRQALIKQLQLPETAANSDFLDLLSAAVNSVDKPLILLFDQFEHFSFTLSIKPIERRLLRLSTVGIINLIYL